PDRPVNSAVRHGSSAPWTGSSTAWAGTWTGPWAASAAGAVPPGGAPCAAVDATGPLAASRRWTAEEDPRPVTVAYALRRLPT
ncbi:hypothetical protein, partial [Streptomyces nanshensis]|uniref:hypothetical protein n=1 Tax=Streptomyces nanshensis TaxID=518642 RepID=UPI001C0AB707